MLAWLRDFAGSGVDLITLRASAAEKRLRQLAPMVAVSVLIGCVGGVAICGVLAAVVLLATPSVGLPVALVSVSLGVLVPIVIVAWVTHRRLSAAAERSAMQARAAQERLTELLSPGETPPEPDAASDREPLRQLAQSLASNPQILASGVFAALSVLGARRTIRLIRAASAVASAGAVVSKVASGLGNVADNGREPGRPASRGRSADSGSTRDSQRPSGRWPDRPRGR